MNETTPNYYLVRTLAELVEKSIVGVGWSDYNFAQIGDAEEAIAQIDADYGIRRWGNQIRRFFAINNGDVIVAPLPYSVAIGRADGAMFYDEAYFHQMDRANQRRVSFPRDQEENLITIPRTSFSEAFQRRIKVMGMTVNGLSEFGHEIQHALDALESGSIYTWTRGIDDEVARKREAFKKELLANIQSGQTNLQTGSVGLENLVKELLILDGYQAEIMSKRALGGYADADVLASRTDRCATVQILVQVKHHHGFSGDHGIRQLGEIKKLTDSEYAEHELVFLTSASVTEDLIEQAADQSITVIDGDGLVDWITEKIDLLHPQTKQALGICEVPSVVGSHASKSSSVSEETFLAERAPLEPLS